MAIFTKNEDVKSHKYKRDVYVEINPKTKLGQDLLKQYHEQSSRHYMDIGRIGYHDNYGRYKLDNYTVRELKVVPKLIVRVIKTAMNRAGKDVYQLRTYMSKFGQLNFLLTIDQNCSELILIENIYISNLNFRQEYETSIWKINHYNSNPVPLRQIFSEFGVRANPDDYGKSWREENIKINNIIVAKSKANYSLKMANAFGSRINQKALVSSLNNLNHAGDYGKKITSVYSAKVTKKEELNKLASSKRLENTLNQVLLGTLDDRTDKKDLKTYENSNVYKKVVEIQFTAPKEIADEVEKKNTKENLKTFMVESFDSRSNNLEFKKNENVFFDKQQEVFEKIIDRKFDKKTKKEIVEPQEEEFDKNKYAKKNFPNEYKDFENRKVNIILNTDRFLVHETKKAKKLREKEEIKNKKALRIQEKKDIKLKKHLKKIDIVCNIDEELEKSKLESGIKKEKKKKKTRLGEFFERVDKKKEAENKKTHSKNLIKKNDKKQEILAKIEDKIKKQNLKIAKRKEQREIKKQIKLEKKKKNKKKLLDDQFFDERKSGKKNRWNKKVKENEKGATNQFRPVVKPSGERPKAELENEKRFDDNSQPANKTQNVLPKANIFENKTQLEKINSSANASQILDRKMMNKAISKQQNLENYFNSKANLDKTDMVVGHDRTKKHKEKTLEM